MMNIKNDVFASGFIQGLAFENIGKAIETGLIAKEEEYTTTKKLLIKTAQNDINVMKRLPILLKNLLIAVHAQGLLL